MTEQHENKFITKILDELRKAESKHPKFCDEMLPPGFDFAEEEKRWKKWNDEATTHYACDLFNEEFYEALNAYQMNALVSCMEELAQCGAVILRTMEFVQKEMDSATLGTGVKPNACARSAGAMGRL